MIAYDATIYNICTPKHTCVMPAPKCVTAQQDDIGGMAANTGNARIGDVVDGVAGACVFSEGGAAVVHITRRLVDDDVLQHRTKADGCIDLWLTAGLQPDALGIAPALDVEHACNLHQ